MRQKIKTKGDIFKDMKCQDKVRAESGNILFIILVAIALFGALSFAVSNMMRSGNAEAITEQKASILADEILAHARDIRQTVQTLKISNGCEDTEISFENATVSGYEHSPVTRDACKVYHPDGGGLNYIEPVYEWLAPVSPTPVFHGEWYFGPVCASDIGQSGGCDDTMKDVVLFLPYINEQLCLTLNDKMGIDNPAGAPPTEAANGWTTSNIKFDGDFSAGGTQLQQNGNRAGCFEGNSAASTPPSGTYHFYQVMIVR